MTPAAAPMLIAKFVEAIIAYYQADGRTRDTLKQIRRAFGILERQVGVNTVTDLERDEIDGILRRFGACIAKFSPHTQGNYQRVLFASIRKGHALGLLRVLPRLPKLTQIDALPKGTRIQAPSPDDVHRLMNHLAADKSWRGRRLHSLASLVLLARLPLEAATRIEVENVDLAGGKLGYRPRYRGRPLDEAPLRTVRIGGDLAKILEAWIPQAGCKWLIPGWRREGYWASRGGQTWTPTGRLKAACAKAGIKPMTFEAIRRFHAERVTPHMPFATFSARVILTGPSTPPIVNGRVQPVLTIARYNVIKALWVAAPGKLSGEELKNRSGHRDAVNILKAVHEINEDWASVIDLPREPGKGYGLLV